MKPYYFVKDVLEQLKSFDVDSIEFEIRVGADGYVGTGDSLLKFTLSDIIEKDKKDKL
jgi:hypothetical protein